MLSFRRLGPEADPGIFEIDSSLVADLEYLWHGKAVVLADPATLYLELKLILRDEKSQLPEQMQRPNQEHPYTSALPGQHIPVPTSHTNSKSWVAPKMAEQEKFAVVLENLTRMEFIPRSPFVPRTMNEWLAHRVALAEDTRKTEMRKLADKEAAYGSGPGSGRVRIGPAFGGKQFHDNRSPVLAMETIWSPWYQPTEEHPQAMWPSLEEMKEEGDERNTSGFGRFPALPRVPGNETVVWKQKNVITPYPFDRVWDLPKLETEEKINDEQAMEEMIGEDLLQSLDA